jgi:hypothetical protein
MTDSRPVRRPSVPTLLIAAALIALVLLELLRAFGVTECGHRSSYPCRVEVSSPSPPEPCGKDERNPCYVRLIAR